MKKEIAIIGAFDRYNYGDLLFPIIIERYLIEFFNEYLYEYNIKFYGLIKSDLSIYGGKITNSIGKFSINNIPEGSLIIICGGDVLPARLSDMYLDLENNRNKLVIKKICRKIIGRKLYESFLKRTLGINNNFPWIFSKNNFKEEIKIFYNAVGGASLDKLNFNELKGIENNLKTVDYISVRDKKTQFNLKNLKTELYPDSATIMSEFFTNEYLKEKISNNVKIIVDKFYKKYICIQSNLISILNKEDVLARQLEQLYMNFKLNIVLLPIGMASNHDDVIALRRLKKRLNVPATLLEEITVYDIMYLISNCSFFAGTSLHGNITAMSYGVPHIGLNKKITKLDEYLKTWDLKEQSGCIEFEELCNEFNKISNISNEKIFNKRQQLIMLCKKNFDDMFNIYFND